MRTGPALVFIYIHLGPLETSPFSSFISKCWEPGGPPGALILDLCGRDDRKRKQSTSWLHLEKWTEGRLVIIISRVAWNKHFDRRQDKRWTGLEWNASVNCVPCSSFRRDVETLRRRSWVNEPWCIHRPKASFSHPSTSRFSQNSKFFPGTCTGHCDRSGSRVWGKQGHVGKLCCAPSSCCVSG